MVFRGPYVPRLSTLTRKEPSLLVKQGVMLARGAKRVQELLVSPLHNSSADGTQALVCA